ncbi:hypothetical protein [Halobacterium zhouii]|uniref:hypothetical protein n=1 Tax=Halobacterium zhouii TaxID=2902624 RepID=UPI001E31EA7B|nr:hypothetical protein [Halobacterium zhouii]
MTRDWDSLIPLLDTWTLDTKTDDKRVYEHSERVARIVLEMNGDLVTRASLQGRGGGEWTQNARVPDRDWANADQDDHKNELVCHLEQSFGRNLDSYPLRESETSENDDAGVDVVEEDDAVVVDNTESTQATLDELLESSDIIDAEDDSEFVVDESNSDVLVRTR